MSARCAAAIGPVWEANQDRKSTRLNSSHLVISYAVFCLKKKINSRRCSQQYTIFCIALEKEFRIRPVNAAHQDAKPFLTRPNHTQKRRALLVLYTPALIV